MVIFKRSGERKRGEGSKGSYSKRSTDGRKSFEDVHKGRRDSGRRSNSYSRDRRDVEMTKVICSSCGKECEVPFKPTSTKPVYCNECFAKRNKTGSDKTSNKDFGIINEKLDKIMKALKIK